MASREVPEKEKKLTSSGHLCFMTCNDGALKLEQESKGKLCGIVVSVLPFLEKHNSCASLLTMLKTCFRTYLRFVPIVSQPASVILSYSFWLPTINKRFHKSSLG